MKFFTALNTDVPVTFRRNESAAGVNINWIIKADGERGGSSSHEMTTVTGVAGVTPDWIVQFLRRKSLRVLQLQLQLCAPPRSECLLPERVEAARSIDRQKPGKSSLPFVPAICDLASPK